MAGAAAHRGRTAALRSAEGIRVAKGQGNDQAEKTDDAGGSGGRWSAPMAAGWLKRILRPATDEWEEVRLPVND